MIIRRARPRLLVPTALLTLMIVGCSSGDDSSTQAGTTTNAATSLPASTTSRGVTPPPAPATATGAASTTTKSFDALDWENGLRYDFGMVTALESIDGSLTVEFDRYALYTESGATVDHWDAEPILGWHSDVPWVNSNGKLRRYAVTTNARYLVPTNHCNLPNGDFSDVPPTWGAKPLADFEQEVKNGYAVVSLTFDAVGSVTQLRLDPGC